MTARAVRNLAELLGDPTPCSRCKELGMPASAEPESDLCKDHRKSEALFAYGVELARVAVGR